MEIALFVTSMCMFWGVIRQVRLTYGIYIGFAFMMLLLDSVIWGMVNQSQDLSSIRSRFKRKSTFIGFQACMGLQVGIRAVSIPVCFGIIFQQGVSSLLTTLNSPGSSGLLSMAMSLNPATAPLGMAGLATSGMKNMDLTSLSKMFMKK
jgi:hypothetical protein